MADFIIEKIKILEMFGIVTSESHGQNFQFSMKPDELGNEMTPNNGDTDYS
ncbi:16533_t:CDS:2 [Entrophospora sp. SA101]|nr:16533_t:CDS:2 [Entrophospora sp. SA101]